MRMVALYYAGVPIVIAEGVGARVRESLSLILERLSPLIRGRCIVDWYEGPFPLEGFDQAESIRTYHEVICPVADGEVVHACDQCNPALRSV